MNLREVGQESVTPVTPLVRIESPTRVNTALTVLGRRHRILPSPKPSSPQGESLMSLDRVPGQPFDALVDHADGRRGPLCVRGPPLAAMDLGGQGAVGLHSSAVLKLNGRAT